MFTFAVDFSGSFLTAFSDIGSSFAVSLYGPDQVTVLGNADAGGSLLTFDLRSAGATAPAGVAVSNSDRGIASATSQVVALPEPGMLGLMSLGVLVLAAMGVRPRRQSHG